MTIKSVNVGLSLDADELRQAIDSILQKIASLPESLRDSVLDALDRQLPSLFANLTIGPGEAAASGAMHQVCVLRIGGVAEFLAAAMSAMDLERLHGALR